MKTTPRTAMPYGKSKLTTLVMIVGTAALMSACSSVKQPAREYQLDRLAAATDMLQKTTN